MLDPWQEPPRGGHPPITALTLSGADQLRSLLAGRIPRPPISRLTGMRLVEIGDGTAAFALPMTGWLRASPGAVSIGPLVMPADAAMACAIQTVLPPRTPFLTSELTLRLLAPAKPTGTLTARGRLIKARTSIALAEASLIDGDDQLIAHGTTLCLIQPQLAPASWPADADAPDATDEPAAIDGDEPDPWRRHSNGEILEQVVWEERNGLQILESLLSGELPPPPIHHLTGLTLTAAGPNRAVFALPATEWLTAPPPGRVQGGGVALLAEAALTGAIQTTVPAATALAPIDLKINYLRPLAADGRVATAHGEVIHAGRRIAVGNSEVLDADGRRIAVATGSAMLLPGRPASLGAVEA